jgi:hypothetical protein
MKFTRNYHYRLSEEEIEKIVNKYKEYFGNDISIEDSLLQLEIERLSCLRTASEMSKGDGDMCCHILEITDPLRMKAEILEQIIEAKINSLGMEYQKKSLRELLYEKSVLR